MRGYMCGLKVGVYMCGLQGEEGHLLKTKYMRRSTSFD